ncbi:MAG: hypothetical protein A2745_02600 [Candidatus Harrisonbacteria bacterium RIFCSPHIGHO2_01_FULL_44_13]|uniref:Type II secretion system protein GspH n=1 Tax=Candidatus Harrisonbacteria bacterium RIFCSPLOWO2_01_FULL_44_18 TaxID=1798407 RepID=A0A1G1ZP58_9BACT|nr:MAG: hypothetical protein A2745_02600 [Candidatus Harrisonbacteria bacterium RIFCSPHIGHO2_01_FULL_44_13]OGY66301.1 MAG: hypothetical protein A3A16_00110 [Candidatus Harrisonbacteria bacterium RIFCSPLOWO2_01_FULL_44_18]
MRATFRAFTLLEIVIVLGITAIIASVGFMNLFGFRQRQDLNLETQHLVAFLRDAQQNSITQELGQQWGVHFSNPALVGKDYYTLFSGQNYNDGLAYATVFLRPSIAFFDPCENALVSSGCSVGEKEINFSKLTGLPASPDKIDLGLASGISNLLKTVKLTDAGTIEYEETQ